MTTGYSALGYQDAVRQVEQAERARFRPRPRVRGLSRFRPAVWQTALAYLRHHGIAWFCRRDREVVSGILAARGFRPTGLPGRDGRAVIYALGRAPGRLVTARTGPHRRYHLRTVWTPEAACARGLIVPWDDRLGDDAQGLVGVGLSRCGRFEVAAVADKYTLTLRDPITGAAAPVDTLPHLPAVRARVRRIVAAPEHHYRTLLPGSV